MCVCVCGCEREREREREREIMLESTELYFNVVAKKRKRETSTT